MPEIKKIPKKYHPKGFEVLYEDMDLIIGNKTAGYLTVAALWEREKTIHYGLNQYVRKGNPRSPKRVYVVHRLDQDTSGVLVFAKSEKAQQYLKNNWATTKKVYYAIVHGKLAKKEDVISSYLQEDEDYVVHSVNNKNKGKLARTAYKVLVETDKFSLLKIDLLTGRKNQIRVHLSDIGHPIVGDIKYGHANAKGRHLMLHAYSIALMHPHHKKELNIKADVPLYFSTMINYPYHQ